MRDLRDDLASEICGAIGCYGDDCDRDYDAADAVLKLAR